MIALRSDQQGDERTVPHYCRHRPQRSIQLCKASCTLFPTRLIEALLWITTTTASFNEIQWVIAETRRLTLGCIFEQMQTSEGSAELPTARPLQLLTSASCHQRVKTSSDRNGSLSPEIHTRPSSVNGTQDIALYPTSVYETQKTDPSSTNFSIWNTEHRLAFNQL